MANNRVNIKSPIDFGLIVMQSTLFNWVKTGHLYACIAGEGIAVIYLMLKKKKFSWVHFGISAMLFSNLLFIYIGAYAEFMRSTVYLLPFAYLSLSMVIDSLGKREQVRGSDRGYERGIAGAKTGTREREPRPAMGEREELQ